MREAAMKKPESANTIEGTQLLLILAAIVVVALGMKFAASIITPIALALIVSISMTPVLQWLIRKGMPNGIALTIVIITVVVVMLTLAVIVILSLQNVIQTLPKYQDRIAQIQDEISTFLTDRGIKTTSIRDLDIFSPAKLVNVGVSVASAIAGAMSSWFFMLLLAAYMLLEATDFPRKLEKTLKFGSAMPERFYKLNVAVRSYIFMTVWLGALNAILLTIMLFFLGVDFALLWGVLAFLMSFIPYIGFILALIPPTLMSLLEGGWQEALIVIIGFIILNTITDNIIKPKVMGKGLDLSPVVIMLSLFIWAWILGPVGAILAVPLTIVVKELILEVSDDTRWIANLMMPSSAMPGSVMEEPGEE
jgi:AI-2 transport protein TqsA